MQTNKVAILIDGGFFNQRFQANNKRFPQKKDVEGAIGDIMTKVNALNDENSCNFLFRTFYYDCYPFGKELTSYDGKTVIDFSQKDLYTDATNYLKSLKFINQFALRLGELSFTGWKVVPNRKHPSPDFKQKGVDMKIGLDMAWMAGKKSVQKMVLVTGDSDFVSPIKHVRREGIIVYLYPMGFKYLKSNLKEHCDFII